MTAAYSPTTQWRTEALRDAAIDQLASYQAQLEPLREKYLDTWQTDEAFDLIAQITELEQRILATVSILVRRHELAKGF